MANMKCAFDGCERSAVSRSYCDKHYRRLLKRGDVNDFGSRKKEDGNDIERFHKKYEIVESGCWIWTAGVRLNGKGVPYPRHWADGGKSTGAHRFSFELACGPIPKLMCVCHKCDTPLCVNPEHLFIGTHQDNMNDMVYKKRSFTGRGESKKGLAKLTNQQAEQVREMKVSQTKIAAIFNVSQTTISRIRRGESY